MKKKNIITPDATERELMELIFWAKAETKEWKSFLALCRKRLKDTTKQKKIK